MDAKDTEVVSQVPQVSVMSREVEIPEYTELSPSESCLVCSIQAVCCPCLLCFLKKVPDYQRVVMLRFGKLFTKEAGTGGLYIVWPFDEMIAIDIRERTVNVPSQAIVSKEGLTVGVDGVIYYKVVEAMKTVFGVSDYQNAVATLAQTKLREILGTKTFEELQSDRQNIALELQQALDPPTDAWGISVTRVELTDVRLPTNIQRAMAQEAESMRNAKAKVIEAEGEERAAQMLKEAADIMSTNGSAMQLRFMQTLSSVATENNSTIVLPFPTDFLNSENVASGPVPKKKSSRRSIKN